LLPILSYAIAIWSVKLSYGKPADLLEVLYESHLVGIRESTENEMLLAELHHFPLQTHFLQQILHFHHEIGHPAPVRYFITVAMMKEYRQTNGSVNNAWQWPKQHNELITVLAKLLFASLTSQPLLSKHS